MAVSEDTRSLPPMDKNIYLLKVHMQIPLTASCAKHIGASIPCKAKPEEYKKWDVNGPLKDMET